MYDPFNWIMGSMLAILALMVFYGCILVDTNQRCLKAGYVNADVSWKFERYCAREENEYEIVVPLADVEQ